MKKRTYRMFIEDILECIDKIGLYIKGLNYETFAGNEMKIQNDTLCCFTNYFLIFYNCG